MNTLLNGLKKSWAILLQFTCWVGVIVGKFVIEPPRTTLTAGRDDSLHHFAQFLGTILIGLLVIACQKWQKKTATRGWTAIAIVVAVLTTIGFFVQRNLQDRWTITYATHQLTVSETLTKDASDYVRNSTNKPSVEDLLARYGGETSQVWPADLANKNYQYLSAWMIGLWIASAACVVCISQAVRCAFS